MAEESIFERMWKRKGFRAEIRAANALAVKQWQIELAYPLSILWFILMPFFWFIPSLIAGNAVAGGSESAYLAGLVGTSDWLTYIAVGSAFTGLAVSLMWGTGMAMRREQNVGTLETLMTAPMRRDTLVWGSTLHNIQHGGLGVMLQLGISVILFGVNLNVWGVLPALGIIALSIIGLQGLVFAIVCVVLLAKQAWMVVEFMSSILFLVAPMTYPIAVLPPILQYVSLGSPLTWSVEGFRGLLMGSLTGPALLTTIVALIVLDVIFIVLGTALFRRTERYVRSRGALSQF
ncbi:MAG: ABC transporter permease [Candidatus Thorarchaeota archaeon]